MISLDFNGGAQGTADYTPDYLIPTGFQAGSQTSTGLFEGDGTGISSGWISASLSGANLYAEVAWPSSGNNTESRGPIFVNSSGNGYMLLVRASDFRFFLINGGTLTQIGTTINQSTVTGDLLKLEYLGSGQFVFYHNGTEVGSETDNTITTGLSAGFVCRGGGAYLDAFEADTIAVVLPSIRKSGTATFDKPAGIGTITGVTLNGNAITLDSQDATTFTVTDSDGTITTSGAYDLVATGDTVETISVQVNVVGVAPSNNPVEKDGAAQASLTGVQVRVTDGANLNGTELYYTGTATTDASGNLASIDLSSTAAVETDPVLLYIRTAAGDSIIASETVGLI